MIERSNEAWLEALRHPGGQQSMALAELREYLRRAVLLYLRDYRSDLTTFALSDLQSMAEDFAQEAVLAVQDNLDRFRGDAKFTTWTYRFVINVAASELRRRRYRNTSLEALLAQETEALTGFVERDPRLDPELSAERRDLIARLLAIIRTHLNERQRAAIVGVHFQGLSMEEVAAVLQTSTNTVYKILFDARSKLRAQLEAQHLSAGDILASFDESL